MNTLIIDKRPLDLGGGLSIGRVLPYVRRRMIGPFIFFDHMGPLTLPAGVDRSVDVRPHPHIGLSTITYLFSGEIMHRDSLGYEQTIRPGAVNWMTAGNGITHSERFERAHLEGDALHGIQAWVALPAEAEEEAPSFSHHAPADMPRWSDRGVHGQVIAGEAYGLRATVRTHSPLFYVHLKLDPGSTAEIPDHFTERAAYVAVGTVEIGGRAVTAGQMIVLEAGQSHLRALEDATVMLLGGAPLGERFLYWNFVSSSKERLAQAAADWHAGRMRLPESDHDERMPLPADAAARFGWPQG